jgi:starch-binding outer membrane protein, SusD/RagB family
MNTINEETPGITGFAGFYTNINQLNLIIDKSLITTILNETDKNYYLGQAYGLRAFYYFHLLRSWGDVVIYDSPSYGFKIDELAKPASPASEVMTFIKADIERSLSSFGNNYAFRTKIKWSQAATLMLKGEVYLWSSRQMGGGTADATVAKNALTQIKTNIPSLRLLPNYRDVFRWNNKGNDEIIFAIRNEQDEYLYPWGSSVPRDVHFGQLYTDSLTGQPYSPTTHNILTTGGGMFSSIYNHVYNGYLPGDTRKYNSLQAAYRLEDGQYVQQLGVWQNKFQGSFQLGLRIFNDDNPIYRYSELLLMLAEAKSLLGEDPAPEINLVRQRAFGPNYQFAVHGYPNQPIDSDINEALLKERLNEFVAEGKRWYDLRRFGTEYVTKYTLANPQRLLWPIDKGVLTYNPALKQNPGY